MKLVYRCYAKLNLTLEVLGRRVDGYHDLASLVHTISVADDLHLEPAEHLTCLADGLNAEPDTNLVTVAAKALAGATAARAGAAVKLTKRIPVAAGLGGGSSDAAATLVGLNRLWGTRLGYRPLVDLAATIGSDVPFFVRGGAAVMHGRGEVLEAIAPLGEQWFVVAIPEHTVANKTIALYAALRPYDFSDGSATRRVAEKVSNRHPLEDTDLVNHFERAARSTFPGLEQTWADTERVCGRPFHLSGAGPALFALAGDRVDARQKARWLGDIGLQAMAARSVRHARALARFAGAGDMS
jgi:4-diphosphocytidyl-2-C-methyl-D-erythritol kinase